MSGGWAVQHPSPGLAAASEHSAGAVQPPQTACKPAEQPAAGGPHVTKRRRCRLGREAMRGTLSAAPTEPCAAPDEFSEREAEEALWPGAAGGAAAGPLQGEQEGAGLALFSIVSGKGSGSPHAGGLAFPSSEAHLAGAPAGTGTNREKGGLGAGGGAPACRLRGTPGSAAAPSGAADCGSSIEGRGTPSGQRRPPWALGGVAGCGVRPAGAGAAAAAVAAPPGGSRPGVGSCDAPAGAAGRNRSSLHSSSCSRSLVVAGCRLKPRALPCRPGGDPGWYCCAGSCAGAGRGVPPRGVSGSVIKKAPGSAAAPAPAKPVAQAAAGLSAPIRPPLKPGSMLGSMGGGLPGIMAALPVCWGGGRLQDRQMAKHRRCWVEAPRAAGAVGRACAVGAAATICITAAHPPHL